MARTVAPRRARGAKSGLKGVGVAESDNRAQRRAARAQWEGGPARRWRCAPRSGAFMLQTKNPGPAPVWGKALTHLGYIAPAPGDKMPRQGVSMDFAFSAKRPHIWIPDILVATSNQEKSMGTVMITVRATWDDEAQVWVAESTDLPGLILEAANHAELLSKLQDAIPDLIADSGFATQGLPEIPVCVMSEALTTVRVAA